MTRYLAVLATAAFAVATVGCADSPSGMPPAAHPYAGPLYLSGSAAEHPDAGAAGNIVDCRTWGGGGVSTARVYDAGATADSPARALQEEGILGGGPQRLAVAARQDDRVLYVFEVQGVVKEAVVVRNGPATRGAGGPGWYVESWATCDDSEFPRSFTDSIGLEIWTDAAGVPLPTTTIRSSRGPEHCHWQSMTFLELGQAVYVRDPLPDLAGYFAGRYRPRTDLPGNAAETGYRRDGRRLWLSPDKQLAYVGPQSGVEAWPRTIKPLLCA